MTVSTHLPLVEFSPSGRGALAAHQADPALGRVDLKVVLGGVGIDDHVGVGRDRTAPKAQRAVARGGHRKVVAALFVGVRQRRLRQARALQDALAQLPDDYRQVITLRHQEQRSFEEIGILLGRSSEAVRKLWSRAIERLKQELGAPP